VVVLFHGLSRDTTRGGAIAWIAEALFARRREKRNDTGIISLSPNDTGIISLSPNDTGIISLSPNDTGIILLSPNDTGIISYLQMIPVSFRAYGYGPKMNTQYKDNAAPKYTTVAEQGKGKEEKTQQQRQSQWCRPLAVTFPYFKYSLVCSVTTPSPIQYEYQCIIPK
jgi:hypothetical protein